MASDPFTSRRIDFASFGGLAVAVGGILAGLIFEGGDFADVRQMTAALIVLSGTLGALMVTTPVSVLKGACLRFADLFFERSYEVEQVVAEIRRCAHRARKEGMVSLEDDLPNIADPFLRKSLTLAVDGADRDEIREVMELELDTEERQGFAEAKVFDAAGGYAPTIGILGAVLGLIQVMKHLDEMSRVGHGIAVAFVATVYGVAIANLFFLPAAAKLRARVEARIRVQELMIEGASGIAQGLHPTMIDRRLQAYVAGASTVTRTQTQKVGRVRAA